jgi:hypothetical protein
MKRKSSQIVETKRLNKRYSPSAPIKVTSLKAAKRLLSRLIYDLQTGAVDNQTAKDLTYLLASYVNIFKTFELQTRIEILEKNINE